MMIHERAFTDEESHLFFSGPQGQKEKHSDA